MIKGNTLYGSKRYEEYSEEIGLVPKLLKVVKMEADIYSYEHLTYNASGP